MQCADNRLQKITDAGSCRLLKVTGERIISYDLNHKHGIDLAVLPTHSQNALPPPKKNTEKYNTWRNRICLLRDAFLVPVNL